MADVNANINIDVNSSPAIASLRNLEAQINRFQRSVTNANAAGVSSLNKGLVDSINATNLFNSKIVDATSSSKRFSDALDKGKLSLGQYVSHAASQMPGMSRVFKREFDTIEQVAKTRVRAINSQYIALGKTVDGVTRAIKSTPTGITEGYSGNLAVTAQRQQMLNKLIDDGSTKLLNWGKNTQWAGRQLMVGFSLPLAALGTVASQTFMEIDKAGLSLRRVYGDLSTTTEEVNANVDAIKTLGAEYTKYGIALSDTIAISGRAAATGATNEKLLAQTEQTLRFATLGQIDYNTALDSTIALQTAFGVSNEDLAKKIDFLNAVENQTILTIEDMSLAIPRVATVIKGLGGDVEDLAVMMTAMREGGVSAENAANALKSGLASLINPTKRATESLSSMGINIQKIISNNKGDLMGLIKDFANATNTLDDFSRQQVFEQVFGKYQYARMSALFTNIARDSGQAARAMELAGRSAQELAAIADKELNAISDTTTVKFKAAMEQLKISIAPLGEAFLKGITPIVELVTKVAEAFNNLPDGVKNSIAVITGLVGGLGPVLLMTIGLIGNGIANIVKAFQFFRKTLARLKGDASAFQYMATAEMEALVATERLEGGAIQLTRSLHLQRNAVDALTTSYMRFAEAAGIAGGAMSTVGGRPVPGGRGGRPLPPPVRRNRGGSIPYFSDGGSSTVPGVGNTDTVPAMLTPGEFVVNKQSTKENLPLLHAINDGQEVQYRNKGGGIANSGRMFYGVRQPAGLEAFLKRMLSSTTGSPSQFRTLLNKTTNTRRVTDFFGNRATTQAMNDELDFYSALLRAGGGEGYWESVPDVFKQIHVAHIKTKSRSTKKTKQSKKAWEAEHLRYTSGIENVYLESIFSKVEKLKKTKGFIDLKNSLSPRRQNLFNRLVDGTYHPTTKQEYEDFLIILDAIEEKGLLKNKIFDYIDDDRVSSRDQFAMLRGSVKFRLGGPEAIGWKKDSTRSQRLIENDPYNILYGFNEKGKVATVADIARAHPDLFKEYVKPKSRRYFKNEGGIIPGVQHLMSGSLVRRPNQSILQVAKTAKGKELDDILYSRNSKGKLDIDAQTLFEIVRRKDLDEKQLSDIKKYFGRRIKTGIFGDFVDNQNGRKTRVSDPQLSTWRKIAKVLENKGYKVFNKGGMIPGVQYKSTGGPLRFHQLSLFEQYLPHTAKYNSEVYRLRSGILRPGAMRINASGYLSMIRSVDRYIPGFDKMPLDEQIAYLSALREGRMPTSAPQQDPWGGLAKAEPWVIELLASEEGQSRMLMAMLGRAAGHSLKTTGQLPQASEDLSVHSGRMVRNLAELGIIRDPRTPDSHPNWINQPSDLLDGITIDPSAQRQLSPMEEMQGLEFIRAVLKRGRSQSRARSAELDLSDLIEEFLKQQSFGSRIIGANKGGMIPGMFARGVQKFIDGGKVFGQMLGIGGPTYDSPTSSTPIVPGVGNTDTVPAMLTPGEFVINKQATSENLPLLHAINNGGVIGANKGGMIPGVQYFGWNPVAGIMNRQRVVQSQQQLSRQQAVNRSANMVASDYERMLSITPDEYEEYMRIIFKGNPNLDDIIKKNKGIISENWSPGQGISPRAMSGFNKNDDILRDSSIHAQEDHANYALSSQLGEIAQAKVLRKVYDTMISNKDPRVKDLSFEKFIENMLKVGSRPVEISGRTEQYYVMPHISEQDRQFVKDINAIYAKEAYGLDAKDEIMLYKAVKGMRGSETKLDEFYSGGVGGWYSYSDNVASHYDMPVVARKVSIENLPQVLNTSGAVGERAQLLPYAINEDYMVRNLANDYLINIEKNNVERQQVFNRMTELREKYSGKMVGDEFAYLSDPEYDTLIQRMAALDQEERILKNNRPKFTDGSGSIVALGETYTPRSVFSQSWPKELKDFFNERYIKDKNGIEKLFPINTDENGNTYITTNFDYLTGGNLRKLPKEAIEILDEIQRYNIVLADRRNSSGQIVPAKLNKGGFIPKLFANDGVRVPGMGNTDTVPAMLTPGEFVVNKQSTQENLPLLHAINDGIRMNRGGQIPGVQYFGGNDPGGEVLRQTDPRFTQKSHITAPTPIRGESAYTFIQENAIRDREDETKFSNKRLNELMTKISSNIQGMDEVQRKRYLQENLLVHKYTNAVMGFPELVNKQRALTGPELSKLMEQNYKKVVDPLETMLKRQATASGYSQLDVKKIANAMATSMIDEFKATPGLIGDIEMNKAGSAAFEKIATSSDFDENQKAVAKSLRETTTAYKVFEKLTTGNMTEMGAGRMAIKGGPTKYGGVPVEHFTEEQIRRVLTPEGDVLRQQAGGIRGAKPPSSAQSQEKQERITGRSGNQIFKELKSAIKELKQNKTTTQKMIEDARETKKQSKLAQKELENFKKLRLSLPVRASDYDEGLRKREERAKELKERHKLLTQQIDQGREEEERLRQKLRLIEDERAMQKARDKEIAKGRRFLNETNPFNQRVREIAASRVPESENLTNKQRGRALAREIAIERASARQQTVAAARQLQSQGMSRDEALQRARGEYALGLNQEESRSTTSRFSREKINALLTKMQGGVAAGSMGASMALGMGSMLPMMKQDEEGKFLGMDPGNAMMGMMGGSMLVGMIPMLGKFAGPAAIALAAIAAVGTGFFLFRKSLDEAATAAAKFGSNVGGTANALGTMSKVIGVADPLQNRKLQQISVLPKDQEQFAQYMQMFQEESGQKFISNLNKSFGEDKFNKLSDYIRNAVAAGMMTVSEGQLFAKAVGAQVGDNLLGTRVAASIAGQDTGSDALLALARKREGAVKEQGMYKEFENTPISTDNLNSANAAFVISAGTEIMKAYNAAVAKAEEEYTKGTTSWENLIKTVDEASAATKTWSDNVSRATLASDDLGATTKGVENSLIASGAVTQEQLDAIKGAGGNIALGANAFDIGSADVFSGEGMFAKATSAISPLGIGYGFDWVSEKLGLTKKGLFSGEGGLTSGSYADFYAQNLVQQGQLEEGTKEYDQAIADAKKAQEAVYRMTGAKTGVARGTRGAGTDYLQAAKLQYIESQGSTQQAIEQANALEQEILVNPMGDAAQAFIKLGMNADSFSQAITTANSDILFSSEALSKRFLDISANIKVPGFQEMFRSYVAGGVDEADREKRLNEIGGIGQGLSPTSRAEAQSRYLSTKTLAQKYYDPATVDSLMNTAKSAGLFSDTKNKKVKLQDYAGGRTIETQVFDPEEALRFEKAIGAAGEAGVTKQVIDYGIRISGEEKKNPSAVLEDLTEKFKDLASLDTQILTALNVKIDENGNPIDGEDVEKLGGQSEALSRGWNMLGALNPNINIQMAASAVLLDGEGNAITDPVAVAKNIMALNKAFSQLTKAKTKEAKLSAQIQIATLYLGEKAGTGEGKVDPAKVVEDARKTLAQIGKDLDKLPPETVSQIIQLGTTFQIQNADLIQNIADLNLAISKAKDPRELQELIRARNKLVGDLQGAQKDTEAGQLGLAIGGGGVGGGGGGGAESALQSFEKGILEQAKMWLDAGATLDQLNKAKGIFAGKIKEGQGIFDKLKNIKGILPRQLEQIIGMGPKGASDFIKKYIKDGKLTKAGKGLLNVEAAYNRKSFLEGLRLTPTTASLDKVRTNLEERTVDNRKVESDIVEKIMNDQNAIEIMQHGSNKEQEQLIRRLRRRRTEEEIIATKTEEILKANEKTQKLLDDQIKKQEDIVEGIQDQIDELEKKNDADQWAIRNKSREKELIDRQIESLERANEMDRRRIETLQRQDEVRNREADALSHELEAMSDLENKIRETYQERIDALDKVTQLNDHILEQERQRLGLSQALSQGDIYAATAAAQEMRQTQAGFAQQQLRFGLEQGMENAVSGLRTSEGLTREQAEERIKTIKDQSYQTSLLIRDIEDAIYARNQEMIPLKDDQYKIDRDIRDLSDQIFARETDIYNIRTKQLDPAMNLLESLNDEKIAAQEITDETISQIEATADLYKNTDELAQKVDNIAAAWHEVNKQIVDANKAAANAWLELGDEPTPRRGETDKEFATRVENWQNERNAIRARRDKAVSDALAQGKAATASYASATPASTTTASTENFYGGIRTYGNGGKIKKYAAGNIVGSGSRDSVNAMLTPGEFVVRKAMVDKYGVPMLKAINQGSFTMPRYNVAESTAGNISVKTQNTSNIVAPMYNNYSVNVSVSNSNASADEIANRTIMKIKQMQDMQVRSSRGY